MRITGASFEGLTNRFERDGAVEGYAAVTGIWSHGQLRAIRQAAPESAPHDYPRLESSLPGPERRLATLGLGRW